MQAKQILLALGLLALVGVAAAITWPGPNPTSAAGAVMISGGGSQTCVVTTAGGVKCWGNNSRGQLGDGTTADSTAPVQVSGLTSGIAAVAAGGVHTCALTTAGGVKCWGLNQEGQLGDGTTTDRTTPVDVSGVTSGVAAVAAGGTHTCSLTTAGGVKCWGRNNFGQLGDGTTDDRSTPVDVSGLTSGVAAVAAGGSTTCALTTAGGVKCWGSNDFGQLGNGTTTDSTAPVQVSGLTSGAAAVAAYGVHTCALTTAGGVKCWGINGNGELGDGQGCGGSECYSPVNVLVEPAGSALTGVAALSSGMGVACALMTAGAVKCWGDNKWGQLGDGAGGRLEDKSTIPVDVAGLANGIYLETGSVHGCAITSAEEIKCWGGEP